MQDSLESQSLQQESRTGRIEMWKISKEGRGLKSHRGNKLRRVDTQLFGQDPFRGQMDGRNSWREKCRYL
jgi:hypothetical protein